MGEQTSSGLLHILSVKPGWYDCWFQMVLKPQEGAEQDASRDAGGALSSLGDTRQAIAFLGSVFSTRSGKGWSSWPG